MNIPMDQWGRDHWNAFHYAATCAVTNDGYLRPEATRAASERYPTRLKEGLRMNHGDLDCLDDAEAAGLLTNIGTGTMPRFRLTDAGWTMFRKMTDHKDARKSYSDFSP